MTPPDANTTATTAATATATRPDTRPAITLIAAVARNGVIGRDGDLVWRDPLDLRHLRQTTMGHAVIMGRKTWDSLPPRFRPLPGRRNLVVTRQAALHCEGAEVVPSLTAALELLARDTERAFVIGGGELYALALPLADTLELTQIDADLVGDTFFPHWPELHALGFVETARREERAADGTGFSFVTRGRLT